VPIRQQEKERASRSQNPIDVTQQRDRVGHVLENVAANDKVFTLVGKVIQSIDVEVGDHVRPRKVGISTQLPEEGGVLFRLPSIYVADAGSVG
jgi:hypothetical protein